jgi:hypothetical protein
MTFCCLYGQHIIREDYTSYLYPLKQGSKLTSTAGLLNVLHSSLGRMYGSFSDPDEYGPCGCSEYEL